MDHSIRTSRRDAKAKAVHSDDDDDLPLAYKINSSSHTKAAKNLTVMLFNCRLTMHIHCHLKFQATTILH
jgi:hypothetical protein